MTTQANEASPLCCPTCVWVKKFIQICRKYKSPRAFNFACVPWGVRVIQQPALNVCGAYYLSPSPALVSKSPPLHFLLLCYSPKPNQPLTSKPVGFFHTSWAWGWGYPLKEDTSSQCRSNFFLSKHFQVLCCLWSFLKLLHLIIFFPVLYHSFFEVRITQPTQSGRQALLEVVSSPYFKHL